MMRNNFIILSSWIVLTVFLLSCKKEAGTGGKATITLFPEWDKTNTGSLSSIKGASVYIWFDGSSSTGGIFSDPKNIETADLKVFGDPNETFITIPDLKQGAYAWKVIGSDPSAWTILRTNGWHEIKWKERKKNITIHTTLH